VAVGSVLTAGITGRNAYEEWRKRWEELEGVLPGMEGAAASAMEEALS